MIVLFRSDGCRISGFKTLYQVIALILKVRVHRGFKPLDETIIRSRNGIKQSI